jgi:hypothetical protein
VNDKISELKKVFNFVRDHQWSNARQIGRDLNGGKSRANHFLYGYLDILFEKRGFSPPQWKVKSDDAYEKMIQRLNPPPASNTSLPSPASVPKETTRGFDPSIPNSARELPRFSICNSCGLPIKPTGACGCS